MPIHAPQPSLVWTSFLVVALVATLFAGAVILQRARRDLIRQEEGKSAEDVAETLRAAYEAGEFTEEEYRKVRSSLENAEEKSVPPNVPRF